MSEVVSFIDPARYDEDAAEIAQLCLTQGYVVIEKHVGSWELAQLSAGRLGVPLVTADRNAHLGRALREADLLGFTTQNSIAKYLTEQEVPTPSGKVGIWSGAQVRRARQGVNS